MGQVTLLVLGDPLDRTLALLERLGEDARVVVGERPEAFLEAAPQAEVVLCWFSRRELLEAIWPMARRLRWVHSASAGVENVLIPPLVESPVPLTNSRGIFSESLAEFVLAAMLFFAKDLRRMVASQQAGRWDPFEIELLAGRWLGIVGYGDIGRAVASRARAMNMKIAALRRRPELSATDPLVDRLFGPGELDELLELSDYLLVALPLTPQTRGLIGPAELEQLKPSAVVINIGRGPVIVEEALIRALAERSIRGAALDVFSREPLPAGHPFYRLNNLLLSPHCADHFAGWKQRAMELFIENFQRFRAGLPLLNPVDKRLGY